MVNAAGHICDQLARWGIDRVFGVSGANIELVFDAAARHPALQPVLAKHEGGATSMAIGWQQRTRHGLPGVVLTTSGGAAFNIVAPLSEALESEIPLLAIVGQCPTAGAGRGGFQDSSGGRARVDAQRILGSVSVRCETVSDPERLPAALTAAAAAAISGRGPAVLLLPRELQAARCSATPSPLPPRAAPATPPSESRRVSSCGESRAPSTGSSRRC